MTAPLTFTLPGARRRGSGAGPDDSGGSPEGVQEGQRLLPHHADTRDHRAKVADQQGNLALHDPGAEATLDELGILTPEEMGYNKPELWMPNPYEG